MPDSTVYFRPGLVILADVLAQGMYTSVLKAELEAHLAGTLYKSIGFVMIKQGKATRTTMEASIRAELKRIRTRENVQLIQQEGYTLPPTPLQIFIVGHIRSHEILHEALLAVRNALNTARSEINYVLFCASTEELDRVQQLAQSEGLTFCYFYENIAENAQGADKQAGEYATGKALFALIATELTATQTFKNAVSLRSKKTRYVYGTLRTCSLFFPEEAIRAYIRAKFGQEVMTDWINTTETFAQSLEGTITERNELQEIHQWVQRYKTAPEAAQISSGTSYNFDTLFWTTCVHSKNNPPEMQTDLHRKTQHLLDLLSPGETPQVQQMATAWSEVASIQYSKSRDEFATWKIVARQAVDDIQQEIKHDIEEQVEKYWDEEHGLERAIMYINNCKCALDELEQDIPPISMIIDAGDQMADRAAKKDVGHHVLTDTSTDEVQQRYRKLAEAEGNMPSRSALTWSALFAIPILALALSGSLPSLKWSMQPLLLLTVIVVTGLIIMLCNMLYFRSRYQNTLVPAQKGVLDYYRNQLLRDCFMFHNTLLSASIQNIRESIAYMTTDFLKERLTEYTTGAAKVVKELQSRGDVQGNLLLTGKITGITHFSPDEGETHLANIAREIYLSMNDLVLLSDDLEENPYGFHTINRETFSLHCRDILLDAFKHHMYGEDDALEKFGERLHQQFDETISFNWRILPDHLQYISSEKLWQDAYTQLQQTHLLSSTQHGTQPPSAIFLYGNNEISNRAAEELRVPMPIIVVNAGQGQINGEFLMLVLYCYRANRRATDAVDNTSTSHSLTAASVEDDAQDTLHADNTEGE